MKHKKWNIVDLVIIVIVAVLLVFGCIKLFSGDGEKNESASGTMKLTYTVKVYGVELPMFESIQKHIPDDLMASGLMVEGRITKVESEPSIVYVNTKSSGAPEYVHVESEDLVNLTFTIEANVDNADVLLSKVGSQEVRIGRAHIVKTEHIEITGTVLTADWEELKVQPEA